MNKQEANDLLGWRAYWVDVSDPFDPVQAVGSPFWITYGHSGGRGYKVLEKVTQPTLDRAYVPADGRSLDWEEDHWVQVPVLRGIADAHLGGPLQPRWRIATVKVRGRAVPIIHQQPDKMLCCVIERGDDQALIDLRFVQELLGRTPQALIPCDATYWMSWDGKFGNPVIVRDTEDQVVAALMTVK